MCCCRIAQPWHWLGPRCRLPAMPSCVACMSPPCTALQGYYCEGGQPGARNGPCPRGRWNPNRGATSFAACLCCPVGKLSEELSAGGQDANAIKHSWLAGCTLELALSQALCCATHTRGCSAPATCQHPTPCIVGHKGPNEGRSVPCEKCSLPQCEVCMQSNGRLAGQVLVHSGPVSITRPSFPMQMRVPVARSVSIHDATAAGCSIFLSLFKAAFTQVQQAAEGRTWVP